MTDEVVRQLSRHAGNSPADCLRHSRALERLGRHDEALAALLPAVDSPDVRAAIVRSPGATAHSGAGAISYVDAPSVAAKPTVQWRAPLGRSAHWSLLASELGIIALSDAEVIALDPSTGSRRWREATGPQAHRANPWLAGDVLLVIVQSGLVARDLWTGESLYRAAMTEEPSFAPGIAVGWTSTTVTARAFRDPRKPPTEQLWSLVLRDVSAVVASEALVVVAHSDGLLCVEPESGSVLWRAPGNSPSVDDHGVFARVEPEGLAAPARARSREIAPRGERVLHARDGEVRWRRHDSLHPRGLTREFGVALKIGSHRSQWAAIERASGKRVALLANPTALAGARGVLYFASGASEGESIYRSTGESRPWSRLAAIGTTGEELWRITPEENPGYFDAIAPLGGRLYAVESKEDEAFVICLA